jgi:hypothetical protein
MARVAERLNDLKPDRTWNGRSGEAAVFGAHGLVLPECVAREGAHERAASALT